MKKSINKFYVYILAAMSLNLSACTKNEKLRVGVNAWPGYEYVHLLHEKGFDKKLGLEVEILFFNSLADTRRSLERNDIDVIGTTVIETLLIKMNTDLNPKIIYATDFSNGGDVVLATQKIKSMKDLKNKKIGVEIGSVCLYTLYLALKANGMKIEDVVVVEADQPAITSGLKNGMLDAGVTYTPFSTELLRNPNYHTIYTSIESPKKIVDVLATTERVVKHRKEDLKKLVQAFEMARQYASEANSDGIKIMAKRQQISENEFRKFIEEDIHILTQVEQNQFFKGDLLQKIIDESAEALKTIDKSKNKKINALEMIEDLSDG